MNKTVSDTRIYLLITASVVIQSLTFLSLKLSTLVVGVWVVSLLAIAFIFLVFRAVLWQLLLRDADLSRVYPYTALVQLLIFIYAVVLFDERASSNNLVGLAFMLGGAFLLSKERRSD